MNKPIKIYAENIEDTAMEQFNSVMEQCFVVQGALMPDVHTGYSLPIGAVVATKGVIVPAWVGYDIGCGMCATRLNITKDQIEPYRKNIFNSIYRAIPTGFNQHTEPQDAMCNMSQYNGSDFLKTSLDKATHQIGTLGGGNHFIEIAYDEEDKIWVVIHSGSRKLGHNVASHYMKIASDSDKAKEGHYALDVFSDEGKNYITDMNFCLQYALENRMQMSVKVIEEIGYYVLGNGKQVSHDIFINRNHNHAEERDGLWIHRKGATHAEKGMMGVIPGNMRDGSVIVEGKGNPDSLYSSSHGAGRVMGRKVAKKTLTLEEFKNTMKGVTAKVEPSTLDEAPMAYKDFEEVLDMQSDLIEIKHRLKPLINIKA